MSHTASIMDALSKAAQTQTPPDVVAGWQASLIFEKVIHLTDENFDDSNPAFMRHQYIRHVDHWVDAVEKIPDPKKKIELVVQNLAEWTTNRSVLKGFPEEIFTDPMEKRLAAAGVQNPKENAHAAIVMRDAILDSAIAKADEVLAECMEQHPELTVQELLKRKSAFADLLKALNITDLSLLYEAQRKPVQTIERPIASDAEFDLF